MYNQEDSYEQKLSEKPSNKYINTYDDIEEGAETAFSFINTISRYGYEIGYNDFQRLRPQRLLNDKIINVYFEMLVEYSKNKAYAFSTYFYSTLNTRGIEWVMRWTKNINIFEHDIIFIPINIPGHWILSILDVKNKVLEIYDSLNGSNYNVIIKIRKYIKLEWERHYKKEFRFKIIVKHKIPKQKNGFDCGVFVCMYGRYRLNHSAQWFKSSDSALLRKVIAYEIFTGKVLFDINRLLLNNAE